MITHELGERREGGKAKALGVMCANAQRKKTVFDFKGIPMTPSLDSRMNKQGHEKM